MLRGPVLSCSEGEGAQYSILVLPIGDWNMNTDDTKDIAHSCSSLSSIRSVSACIRNDADDTLYQLCGHDGAAMSAQIDYIDSLNVRLSRALGLFFDSSDFEATDYNRGWVSILHLCPGA